MSGVPLNKWSSLVLCQNTPLCRNNKPPLAVRIVAGMRCTIIWMVPTAQPAFLSEYTRSNLYIYIYSRLDSVYHSIMGMSGVWFLVIICMSDFQRNGHYSRPERLEMSSVYGLQIKALFDVNLGWAEDGSQWIKMIQVKFTGGGGGGKYFWTGVLQIFKIAWLNRSVNLSHTDIPLVWGWTYYKL